MRPTDPDALPQAFAAAVNRADLDAALALWTDDAVFVAADGTASQGRQAVRAILSALIESGTKIMIAPERIYVAGETAVAVGRLTFGAAASSCFTAVYTRGDDDAWRIAVDAPWGFAQEPGGR